MFTIEKAVLDNTNGEFQEQTLKAAGLTTKTVKLASKKNGLTFHDADGSLFCYGRFSKAVKQALIDKTMTLEQLLAYGKISASEFEGQTYYSLTMPDELRGGVSLGKVEAIAKNAKALAKKTVNIAEISSQLAI